MIVFRTSAEEKDRMNDSILTADVLKTIITNLERGETILEALARLGKGLPRKPKWQNKKNKKNAAQDSKCCRSCGPSLCALHRVAQQPLWPS
jgi:hypothetical protein